MLNRAFEMNYTPSTRGWNYSRLSIDDLKHESRAVSPSSLSCMPILYYSSWIFPIDRMWESVTWDCLLENSLFTSSFFVFFVSVSTQFRSFNKYVFAFFFLGWRTGDIDPVRNHRKYPRFGNHSSWNWFEQVRPRWETFVGQSLCRYLQCSQ